MAVFRNPPKCFLCGKIAAKAKYKDQSDLPLTMRLIGDTFEGWEYFEHDCNPSEEMKQSLEEARRALKDLTK